MSDWDIGLLEACRDEDLFGVGLWPRQVELLAEFERCGRCVWCLGRRSGKTLSASLVALHDCLFRPALDAMVRPGEVRYAVCVSTNLEQSRILLRSARAVVDRSPLLRGLVVGETENELRFDRDGVVTVLRAVPCSARSLRGFPTSTIVLDEAAHFVSVEDGDRAAVQVWTALSPGLAQFGAHGRALIISTPSGDGGFFADAFRRASAGDWEGWQAAQHATRELNPTIPAAQFEQWERESPELFASEYEASFVAGGQAFYDTTLFEMEGEPAAPGECERWAMGLDPSTSRDGFGYAVIGRSRSGVLLGGPIGSFRMRRERTFERRQAMLDRVLEQVAALAREHDAQVMSDQHQSEPVRARLAELGVRAGTLALTRERAWRLHRDLRDHLYAGTLRLPHNPDLARDMRAVTWRMVEGGPKIVLPPRSGRGHADALSALTLALHAIGGTATADQVRAGFGNANHLPQLEPQLQGPRWNGRDPDGAGRQGATPPLGWPHDESVMNMRF